ncbi:MAG TPA: hypothetical protein VGM39_24495 [Kofleriaceae bacterium]|jgi:hypothetical protein
MGFEFSETMEGTVEWSASPGVKHPFKFEITAHAESTREHLRDGMVDVRGVITAPPLAEAADCSGTMTIRPIGQKIIRYELSFIGDDGAHYEVIGQKDIKYRSLVHSWTHLPLDVLDEQHRRVGVAATTFDVKRDMIGFLRSFQRAR